MQPLINLLHLHTSNIADAYRTNYFAKVKTDIVNAIEAANYDESDTPEQAYIDAVAAKDYLAAGFHATCIEQPEYLLAEAISDYCIELVAVLLAIDVDVNYQYVDSNDVISYPITRAMAWQNRELTNLLLLHPDIDIYVRGESLLDNHDVRQFLGSEYKDSAISPLLLLMRPEYKELCLLLDVDLNHEFDNYQTLSALLLENGDMQAIYHFLEAGGQLIDDEGFPAIESAYFDYLHQQNKFTKARLSQFKPLITACLSNSDNEHWLQNLVMNISEERQQDIAQLLGIEDALISIYDGVKSTEGSAISADIKCISLEVYPELSLDITLDVKTIAPWVLPPFVTKLWMKQTRDGCLWCDIENNLGQLFSFEVADLQQKGCVSALSFSEFVLQHLGNIASRVSALIHSNHQALNSLGKNNMPALLELIKHGGVLIKEDNGKHLKQLLASPFEQEFDSLEHFYYQVSEQACHKPNYVVEVTDSKVDLIRFNESNCSYQVVVSYDFYSEPARQQACALVVSHLWELASTL